MNDKNKLNVWVALLVIVVLYFVISLGSYRFRHPEQTETQLFLNIPNVVLWK